MNDKSSIVVSAFSSNELDALATLLAQSDFLPWRFMGQVPRARVEHQLHATVAAQLTKEGACVLGARVDGRLTAIISCEPLPWETKLFGRKAAAISALLGVPSADAVVYEKLIGAALTRLRAEGVKLVTAKTYTTDLPAIHALLKQGFLLMDTMVDVTYQFQPSTAPRLNASAEPTEFVVRLAQPADAAALRVVARAAFPQHFGRFHSDPNIGHETATLLYEEWIQACAEGWCDWVIIAEHQGRIAGFSAWKKPSAAESRHDLRIGHYSIGAIHPDFQGRGLFKTLTLEGMRTLNGKVDYIEGPTHVHNLPVQRGYLKLGWQIADSRHSFHLWLT